MQRSLASLLFCESFERQLFSPADRCRRSLVASAFAAGHRLRGVSAMSDRLPRTVLAVLLAVGTIGVSTQQRTAPATDATSRAVAAAEAILATRSEERRVGKEGSAGI